MRGAAVGVAGVAVPPSLRGPLWWVAVLAAVGTLALGALVAGTTSASGVDVLVQAAVWGVWDEPGTLAFVVDAAAAPGPAAALVGVLIAVCAVLRRWRLGAVAVLGPSLAVGATTLMKPVVGRTIHGADNLAYPSGHTALLTAAALVVGLLLLGLLGTGGPGGAALLGTLAVAAGTVMAVDQVVLDSHYPTDTLGGFLTAVAVVPATALLVDRAADRAAGTAGRRARS